MTTHIVYSDGVADVSVFIETASGEDRTEWAIFGASNSFTVSRDGIHTAEHDAGRSTG